MSNLIPEARVNKNGVSVIKHVRAQSKPNSISFLTQLAPSLGGAKKQRQDMVNDLLLDLQEEEAASRKAEDELYDRSHTMSDEDRQYVQRRHQMQIMERTRIDVTRQITGREETHIEGLKKLSGKTIAMIHETFHGTGQVGSFLKPRDFDDEESVRTAIVFREFSDKTSDFSKVMRHVSEALGVQHLSNIEEGSAEHDVVSAVITVAIEAKKNLSKSRHASLDDDTDMSGGYKRQEAYRKWFEEDLTRPLMSRQLAEVIAGYPDRGNEIVDYIDRQGNMSPADIDIEHLKLHLDNPTPALAEGIL